MATITSMVTRTAIITTIIMIDTPDGPTPDALYRLLTWLSPAYPIGAFSYSSGIEWAVEAGDITDRDSLTRWLDMMLDQGSGFCDGVLFAHAYRAALDEDAAALADVTELAAAFLPSKERHLEATAQGRAFLQTTRASWPCMALDRLHEIGGEVTYPVAAGVACAGHTIPLPTALHAFLHGVVANWISAGTRLIPLGQTDSQRVLAALEARVDTVTTRALSASLDDLGTATFRADLASLHHETQYTRLFRS